MQPISFAMAFYALTPVENFPQPLTLNLCVNREIKLIPSLTLILCVNRGLHCNPRLTLNLSVNPSAIFCSTLNT
jgi:hypothetical protein